MSICTDLEKWPRDNDGCLINFHESTARRVIDEIERLEAANRHLTAGLNEVADGLEKDGNGAFDATVEQIRLQIREAKTLAALDTVEQNDE